MRTYTNFSLHTIVKLESQMSLIELLLLIVSNLTMIVVGLVLIYQLIRLRPEKIVAILFTILLIINMSILIFMDGLGTLFG